MYNYFPWPSNMRTADRVLELRMNEGSAGYGVYVMVLELLRDAEDRQILFNSKKIAYAINEMDTALVERVIKDYGLFTQTSDNHIKSDWLDTQLAEFDSRKETAREAGRRGAAKRWGKGVDEKNQANGDANSTPLATLSDPNSNITNISKDNLIKPTKSKLLSLHWRDYTGEYLFSISREDIVPIDSNFVKVVKAWQEELDATRGRNKHNIEAVLEVAQYFKLNQRVFGFLQAFTNEGEIGSANLMALLKVMADAKATKFVPKFPDEYVIVKVLETNGIRE